MALLPYKMLCGEKQDDILKRYKNVESKPRAQPLLRSMIHYLPSINKNQRGRLSLKVSILSLIPLHTHGELAAPDD